MFSRLQVTEPKGCIILFENSHILSYVIPYVVFYVENSYSCDSFVKFSIHYVKKFSTKTSILSYASFAEKVSKLPYYPPVLFWDSTLLFKKYLLYLSRSFIILNCAIFLQNLTFLCFILSWVTFLDHKNALLCLVV